MPEHANNWIVLMVALPMVAAIIAVLLRRQIMLQRVVGCISLTATLAASVWFLLTIPDGARAHVSAMGSWSPPFGIAIVYDGISGTLLTVASIVALCCFVHCFSVLPRRIESGRFHALFHLLILGVNFSFLTGDLFNLFVAFEIMLMASYALLCLGASRRQMAQAYKYVLLNLLGSTVFVLSAGLMYGMMGTLNYADLARLVGEARASGAELPTGFGVVSDLLLIVFGLKAAMFPLWFWLPDSYPTLPPSITAMFAALLSKVGVYAILRLYPMVFAGTDLFGGPGSVMLPIAAGATMLIAIVGAIGAHEIRRLLAFVLMSHVGYLIFGVVMLTDASLNATLYYMSQEMVVMAGLFLCCGMIERYAGTDDLHQLGGLYKRAPWLSVIMFVLLLSLAGLPPLAGFFGKALLVREGLASGRWLLVAATLTTALITLIAALRVWCHGFWMPARGSGGMAPEGAELGAKPRLRAAYAGATGLMIVAVGMGLAAPLTLSFTARSTEGMVEATTYVRAVLGDGAVAGMRSEQALGAVADLEEVDE